MATNPYALQMNAQAAAPARGMAGFGKLLGRGLHALNPERANEAYDPAAPTTDANMPFKPAGFFRALAGDRSNTYNTAEKLRGVDSTQEAIADELTNKNILERIRENNRLRGENSSALQRNLFGQQDSLQKRLFGQQNALAAERAKAAAAREDARTNGLTKWLETRQALKGTPPGMSAAQTAALAARTAKDTSAARAAQAQQDELNAPPTPSRGLIGGAADMWTSPLNPFHNRSNPLSMLSRLQQGLTSAAASAPTGAPTGENSPLAEEEIQITPEDLEMLQLNDDDEEEIDPDLQ